MKKSQILAALALAFALGVVAPVASTYATITENITEEQKAALDQDIADATKAYNNLIGITEYTNLYNAIDAKNGVRDFVKAADKTVVDTYNEDTDKGLANINAAITAAEAVMTNSGLYKVENGTPVYFKGTAIDAQAKLATMTKLPATVTSATAAYNAVQNLLTVVNENASILDANYQAKDADDDTDPVNVASTQLLNIANGLKAFLNDVYKAAYANTGSTQPEGVANLIKAVSEDAYNTLTKSNNWQDVNEYNTNAVRFNLAIAAAEALPKYSFVADVVNAKTAFDKINSDQSVRYTVALKYIADFNGAIENFANGKIVTPITPETPNNPDPEQPGDDTKDPSAPGTGLVGTAEGNAATTVSIVAGLATALTALGAGVVAYRSARRSNK